MFTCILMFVCGIGLGAAGMGIWTIITIIRRMEKSGDDYP